MFSQNIEHEKVLQIYRTTSSDQNLIQQESIDFILLLLLLLSSLFNLV